MRWPIHLTINILSISLINSLVMRTDFIEPIPPIEPSAAVNLDPTFLVSGSSNDLSSASDSQTGVTLNADLTVPTGNCLFGNRESTDQFQKRQLSSSDLGCPDDNQNEVSVPSAPNLISLQAGPLQMLDGVEEGSGEGQGGFQPEGLNGQTDGPGMSPNFGELAVPSPANNYAPLTRPAKLPPSPRKGSPPPSFKTSNRCPSSVFGPRRNPVCDSGYDDDLNPPFRPTDTEWGLRDVTLLSTSGTYDRAILASWICSIQICF